MSAGAETLEGPATTAAAGAPLVRVDRATLGYQVSGRFHVAVAEASFEISPREKVVVIGPTGCGKTTLLKAIAGFIRPAAGSIELSCARTFAPGPDRAVVFQEFDQLFPWRTVLDNVAYPLRVNGRSRRAADERARELLRLMRLSRAADRYPHHLSGGMKQRVAIARALALEPTILLMDEPFGALDAITRERLQSELAHIVEETRVALFFVTHSIDEALVIGDRVIVLRGAPSTVAEIVDVRDHSEKLGHRRIREQLRSLLALEGGPGDDDVAE